MKRNNVGLGCYSNLLTVWQFEPRREKAFGKRSYECAWQICYLRALAGVANKYQDRTANVSLNSNSIHNRFSHSGKYYSGFAVLIKRDLSFVIFYISF